MRVKCKCGVVLKVPEHMEGKKVRCPKCKEQVDLPSASKKSDETSTGGTPASEDTNDPHQRSGIAVRSEPTNPSNSTPPSLGPIEPQAIAGIESQTPRVSVASPIPVVPEDKPDLPSSGVAILATYPVWIVVAAIAAVAMGIGLGGGYWVGVGQSTPEECPPCIEGCEETGLKPTPTGTASSKSNAGSSDTARSPVAQDSSGTENQQKCLNGDARACNDAASEASRAKDPVKQYEMYKRACEINELECSSQARHLASGTGVETDAQAAIKLFEKACLAGDRWSCEEEGVSAAYGHGKCGEEDVKIPKDVPPIVLWRQYRCDYQYLREEKGLYSQIPDLSNFNPERSVESLTASITDYYDKPIEMIGVIGISDYYNYKFLEAKENFRAFEFHPYRPSGEDLFDDDGLYLYGRRSKYEEFWRELSLQPDDEGTHYRNRLMVKVTVLTNQEHGDDAIWTLLDIAPMIGWWSGLCCDKLETPLGSGTEAPKWPSLRPCSKEDVVSCVEQGYIALGKSDTDKALEAFTTGCEGGGAASCFELGKLYDQGNGVEKDFAKATEFFFLACKAEHRKACTSLSIRLIANPGGDMELVKQGWELLQRMCNLGERDACKMKRAFEARMKK